MPPENENLDVRNATESSTVDSTSADESGGDNQSASPTDQAARTQSDTADKTTMSDVIKEAFDTAIKASESQTEGEEAEADSDAQKLNKTEEEAANDKSKVEDQTEEVTTEDKDKGKDEEKGPVPLERFQEVVKARQQVEQELNTLKPAAEQHQKIVEYCEQAHITPQQFQQMLEVQALLNTNPAEALKRLLPIVEQLQGATNGKLPDDLQREVDSGDLPLARAKEIAQLRVMSQHGEKVTKMTAAQRQAEQQRAEARRFQETLMAASDQWETTKRAKDPDYKPRAKPTDPMGKWEMTEALFLKKLHSRDERGQYVNLIKGPQDIVTLLDQAYSEASATFAAQRPKPKSKPVLTRNGSSSKQPKSFAEAKSLKEVVDMVVAGQS